MRVLLATEPGAADRPNEDFAAVAPGVAVLLDGAGERPGADTGCVHGIAWYAHTLGGFLVAESGRASAPLGGVLASGIEHVSRLHTGTCDLGNPHTPGATVIMARQRADNLEYLVLCDSVLLIQPSPGTPWAVCDDRLTAISRKLSADVDCLPAGVRDRHTSGQSYRRRLGAARNQPEGFWLAAANPAAAAHALTGMVPVAELSSVALLSDGASRIADSFGRASWDDVCAVLAADGACSSARSAWQRPATPNAPAGPAARSATTPQSSTGACPIEYWRGWRGWRAWKPRGSGTGGEVPGASALGPTTRAEPADGHRSPLPLNSLETP